MELPKTSIEWATTGTITHNYDESPGSSGEMASADTPRAKGGTIAYAYGIDDAAEPLENEDRGPVVIQIVALGCLNAHGHEGLGFRFCTCQKSTWPSQLGKSFTHRS